MTVLAATGAGRGLRRRLSRTPLWGAAPGVAFLAVFFLFPVLRLLLLSVQDADGGFSLGAYARAFSTTVYLHVLAITFAIAAETTLISLLAGLPLAYWLTHLPPRRRGPVLLLVMLPFWTSALVKTFAWLIILGRNGVLNRLLLAAGLIDHPLGLLHGRGGVMVGMVQAMLPLAVLTMLPVMLAIDRRLNDAARTLGASSVQAFWRVFFHLALPGLAAAGLLVFISALGYFITPALLGGPHDTMLAQLIITEVQEMMDWNFGGALAVLMVAAALLTCWLYERAFGIASVAGGAALPDPRRPLRRLGLVLLGVTADALSAAGGGIAARLGPRLSGWALPAFCLPVLAFLSVPTMVMLPMGFTSSSFLDFPPPGFGLSWFRMVLASPLWRDALLRSLAVAAATGIVATVTGALAAYAVARQGGRWGGALFALFLAPLAIPRIVVAFGLFTLFARLHLVGTSAGLAIGHAVLALPMVFVTVLATFKGYDWHLDQAAATLGADRRRVLVLITAPLVRSGLAAAFLFAFITSFDELTVAIFVSGGIVTTLPRQMWDDMILQLNPTLAAVSAIVFVIVAAALLVAELLRRAE